MYFVLFVKYAFKVEQWELQLMNLTKTTDISVQCLMYAKLLIINKKAPSRMHYLILLLVDEQHKLAQCYGHFILN